MKEKALFGSIAVVAIAIVGALILIPNGVSIANAQGTTAQKNVVRDSETILLEGKTIPSNDYIHLYDSTPYMIINGHIAAKLPCDANSTSPLNILIGQAPNLKPAVLEFVKPLSSPGKLCIYHADVPSKSGEVVTDIAIQNPTGNETKFAPTSTIVIGVNEISPLSSAQANMTGTNMTAMTK